MGLMVKQLLGQLRKNRVLVCLMFLLMVLTSLSFYFVRFSVDMNRKMLLLKGLLNEQDQLYLNALRSNTSLAYTFWFFLTGLTGFVVVMFFYRFFRSNRKMIGCLKALGFRERAICGVFVVLIGGLALTGALAGMAGGYYLSDVLLDANRRTYAVTAQYKGIGMDALMIGVVGSTVIFAVIAWLSWFLIRGKEAGALISGTQHDVRVTWSMKLAGKAAALLPEKHRLAVRIALQKPVSVLLIVVAVMSFQVCVILGRSLNISSGKVFQMQTAGHNYDYETEYPDFRTGEAPAVAVAYAAVPSLLQAGGVRVEQTLAGLYELGPAYVLEADGASLPVPAEGTVYINPGLAEVYGIKRGDKVTIAAAGGSYEYRVSDIAYNAQADTVYVAGTELAERLGLSDGTYNRVLGVGAPEAGGITRTQTQRVEALERDAVSNQVSAVINQVTGVLVGGILLFLALYVNFQDNVRDMLILHMTGYRRKAIRKLLVDVYLPVLWAAFVITLAPGIWLVKMIHRSLSVSTGDYMPFGTSLLVVILTFTALNIIYQFVQNLFSVGINHIICKEDLAEFTAFE